MAGEPEHGLLPAVLGVDEHDMAGTGALQPEPDPLGGDRPAHENGRIGPHLVSESLVGEQVVGGRDHARWPFLAAGVVGAAPDVGDGLAEDGPAGPGREASRLGGPAQLPVQSPARPRPGHHHSPLVPGDDLGQVGQLRRRLPPAVAVTCVPP